MAWINDGTENNYLLFRNLTDEEEKQFQEYAIENSPDRDDWGIFHPVCRKVWRERGFIEVRQ